MPVLAHRRCPGIPHLTRLDWPLSAQAPSTLLYDPLSVALVAVLWVVGGYIK